MKLNRLPALLPEAVATAGKYYHWWTATLKSCVPAQLQKQLNRYSQDIELILRHEGDSVFLQDSQGEIIDSISLDPSQQKEAGLDFDLTAADAADTEDTQDHDIDTTHIELSGHAEVIHHPFKRKDKDSDRSEVTLNNIDLTERTDSTIAFNRDDRTTRLTGLVAEDDTMVIEDDQGTLLDLVSDKTQTAQDSTVLYYSDRGKIKAIDPQKEVKTTTDIDISLDTLPRDSHEQSYIEFDQAAALLQSHPGNKKCLYLIPQEKVFSLTLNYPVETLENIENVLRYDLEKHIPLNFQEVRYFYALNVLAAQGRVDVEVIVIKSVVFDHLVAAFSPENGRDIICTTQHFFEQYGTRINMLGALAETKPKSLINGANIHGVMNAILLLAVLALPYFLSYQDLHAIQPKSADEVRKAGEIVSTINQLNAEIELGKKLNQRINSEHRVVELLARLSENIETDAWVSRFTYKNGEIKLKGEAVSATAVSDDLNDLGIFDSIKFTTSIIKIPNTNKETFELALRLKPNA